MRTQTAEARPEIEYPLADETVVSSQYTFRIAAPVGVDGVDVSIDQGPWLAARSEVGYWWYDWSGYGEGEHEVIARVRSKGGRWRMSDPREFRVVTTESVPVSPEAV
jgi:hypothetical protein